MIKKVFKIRNLNDTISPEEELKYWLEKSPEERIEAVEYLRRQYYGSTERLQRVVRVIEQK